MINIDFVKVITVALLILIFAFVVFIDQHLYKLECKLNKINERIEKLENYDKQNRPS